jgi:hypothetical protein
MVNHIQFALTKRILNWTWKNTPITFDKCLPGTLEQYKLDDDKINCLTFTQSEFDVSLTADDVAKLLWQINSDHGPLRGLDIMKLWLPKLTMKEGMTIRSEM